jgi:ferredoxin-NADP reductase
MKMKLIVSKEPQPGVHTFVFEPSEPISWQPGQYMHYIFEHPDPDERGFERWFTIASPPYEKNIQITTRIATDHGSSFKQALLSLKIGDSVEANGPKGQFILRAGDYHHILIAGGIGITPYHSMLAQLAHDHKPANADILYANNDDNFVFDAELAGWAGRDPSLKIHKFVDKHIEAGDLKPYLDEKNAVYYLSGPRAMVESYETLLPGLGVAKDNIMTDYFPGY